MLNSSFEWAKTKQFSFSQILLAFAIPSAIAFIGFRSVLPMIHAKGIPAILAWPAVASTMLFLFVIAAVILLKKDAAVLQISLKERMCLKPLSLKQWGAYLGILILGFIVTLLFSKLSIYMTEIPFLSVPDYFPFFLNPGIDPMTANPAILAPGVTLKGAYWLLPLIGLTLTLNILTEELYFRAWLQPKMNNYGAWSWVLNGFMFACYHTYQIWLFPQILPISLVMAFVVYKSKSIWPAIAIHMVVNTMTVVGLMSFIVT